MCWEGERQSSRVEVRRDAGGLGGFGPGGRPIGINPLVLPDLMDGAAPQVLAPAHAPPPGDRAAAWVSAVLASPGHVRAQVPQGGSRGSAAHAHAVSVRVQLQAHRLAGPRACHSPQARHRLQQGDIDKGPNAASQIGDDTPPRRCQGAVVPESFTHGTSAQRVAWFRRGLQSGRLRSCDTFNATYL
jgi:predicted metalloprotease